MRLTDPWLSTRRVRRLWLKLVRAAVVVGAVLLAGSVLGQVIASLRRLGLTVIIDAPPAGFAADVLPLAREADATLLIVHSGSRWKEVEGAADTLRDGKAGDPAAVLVGTRRRVSLAVRLPHTLGRLGRVV